MNITDTPTPWRSRRRSASERGADEDGRISRRRRGNANARGRSEDETR